MQFSVSDAIKKVPDFIPFCKFVKYTLNVSREKYDIYIHIKYPLKASNNTLDVLIRKVPTLKAYDQLSNKNKTLINVIHIISYHI